MQAYKNIEAALRSSAQNRPDAAAITELGAGGSTITYAALYDGVCLVRTAFGETPQTVVAALPNGITGALVWLASLTGGHTLVPLSPELTDYEFAQATRPHKVDIVVSDRAYKHSGIRLIRPAELTAIAAGPALAATRSGSDGSVYLSTSGSTGTPKGILLSARQCVLTAQHIIVSHQLTERDRGLTPLPFSHVNAPIVSLLSTVLSGGSLAVAPKYSTAHFWEWVEAYNPTWISAVPTIIRMLLTTERPGFLDTAALRFVRTASAPLPATVLRQFEEKFHVPVIETYGLSEAASTVAANPLPPALHKPGSVGLPIGVDLEIRSPESGKAMAASEIGEVWIRGQNVITQYANGADPAAFQNGWFKTGDLGYVDAGGYVFLVGRSKDIIIRGGENIFPREIEEVLTGSPDVQEAVAVGRPDQLYGEIVVAFVVPVRADPPKDLVASLTTYAQERLSRPKVPVEIMVLPSLPKTRAGKVNRPLLRERAARGGSA